VAVLNCPRGLMYTLIHFVPAMLAIGCGSKDETGEGEIRPAVAEVVDGSAPSLRSWSGAMDCCGEDPHPVHGTVLTDGSAVLVGKSHVSGDIAGFVTRWMAPDGPAVGRFVDGNDEVIAATVELGPGSVLAQVIEVGDAIVAVGFQAPSADAQVQGIALAFERETLSVVARFEVDGPEVGTSAVFESVTVTPSGSLVLGGSWGSDRDAIEGLKSFGNIVGGRGLLVEVDTAVWFAAGGDGVSPDDIGATVRDIPEVQSVKSMRATSGGFIAAVGHDDDERSGFVWVEPGLTGHRWTRFDDGFELTDAAVVQRTDGQEALVLVGHGGSDTIDGHAKLVSEDGDILWTTTFGNPGIQPEDAPAGELAPDKFIFDECWGVATIDTGVVVACGSGIEGCDAVEATAAEQAQCQADPRRSWRSHLVGISTEGEVLWSRTESFVDETGEAYESASEFVAVGSDGDLYSVVDQNFGVGLARYGE
jgi:hypothetical protein